MIYYSLVLLFFISKTNFRFGQKMNSVSDDPKKNSRILTEKQVFFFLWFI